MKIMFPKIPERDQNPYYEIFHNMMRARNIKPEVWYEYEIVSKNPVPLADWIYYIRLIDLGLVIRIPLKEILKKVLVKIKEEN